MDLGMDANFILVFAQNLTIVFGLMISIVSVITYLFITERYAEALFGNVVLGTIIPLVLGLTMLPSSDIGIFIILYAVIFLVPYLLSNLSLFFVDSTIEWVVRHTYAFYGWLVGTILFVLSQSLGSYSVSTDVFIYRIPALARSFLYVSLVGVAFSFLLYYGHNLTRIQLKNTGFKTVLKTIIAKFN